MTTSLAELLVVIPVRHDGEVRRRNLVGVLRAFLGCFRDCRLLLVEQDERPRFAAFARLPGVSYLWINRGGPFHRTRLLNLGFREALERPFVAAWDADVIPDPKALGLALQRLRDGAGCVLPYDGRFIDIRGNARARVLQALRDGRCELPRETPRRTRVLRLLNRPEVECVNHAAVGGAVLFRRRELAARGGYNERFIAWGWDDSELALRMAKLGCPQVYIPGCPLFHLAHPRRRDSSKYNPHFADNLKEFRRIRDLSATRLLEEISAGWLRSITAPPRHRRGRTALGYLRLLGALLSK